MIDGLKIQIEGTELRKVCDDRWAYHLSRVDFYKRQVDGLREGGLGRTNVSGDPVRDLEERLKQHEARARYFAFVRDHVVTEESYRLAQPDLRDLEITDRY